MKSKSSPSPAGDSRPHPPVSRFDQAYEYILEEILSERMAPGTIINRREIAARLGVSISPVGEAMLQLELEGVLETVPRKGTRVRRPTQRDVWGMLITRIALECQAARMFCGEPVKAARERIEAKARAVDAAPPASSLLLRADAGFHHALVELTDCPALLWHFDRLIRQSLLLLRGLSPEPHRRSSHVALVESLANSDPDQAEQAMREHIMYGKTALTLERGAFEDPVRPRLGYAPLLAQKRLGRSMQLLLDETPASE